MKPEPYWQEKKRRIAPLKAFSAISPKILPVFYILYVLLLAEVSGRVFLSVVYKTPIMSPEKILFEVYPELQPALETSISRTDDAFDILLVGGSVLHEDWGSVERQILEKSRSLLGKKVRVFNVSRRAHTSRDSLFKYSLLVDKRFDLVVLYHGINDLRVNLCPEALFRPDYTHFMWYDSAGNMMKHLGHMKLTVLPFMLGELRIRFRARFGYPPYAKEPKDLSNDERRLYSNTFKALKPFRENLESLLRIAAERRDPVVFPSFAHYMPDNYTLAAFREKSLDYGRHESAVEIWGEKEAITRGIEENNRIHSALCRSFQDIACPDFAAVVPKNGRYFDDICHLTDLGSALFADMILETAISVSHGQGS